MSTVSPEIKKMRENFVFSPSSLMEFEASGKCLYSWYKYWVERAWKRPETLSMLQGRYFEYLCLGKSPFGDAITELPKVAGGADSVITQRIKKQAEHFKTLFDPDSPQFMGELIIATHVKITSGGDPNMRGILDFVTRNVKSKKETIWDLKLTQSVDTQYGVQPWGNIGDIDPLQLGTYKAIYKDGSADTKYYVAEHGPRMARQIINMNIDESALYSIVQRYKEAYRRFKMGEFVDFEAWVPSLHFCNKCPLVDCKARYKFFEDDVFVD